jgi:tRNA pseudouridine65 synthase
MKSKPFVVLSETTEFLAIDKPAGLSVHNEDTNQSSVLQLLGPNHHLVHRLDKETSGILLIAKNGHSAALLMKALNAPTSLKLYLAILRGEMKEVLPTKSLDWTWPISDKGEGRQNPQGKSVDRVEAHTKIAIIEKSKFFTKVRAQILTGRQHQIRKHAAISRHPVVGDSRYNDKDYNTKIFNRYQFNQMLLHAEQIEFNLAGIDYSIKAPSPEIFQSLI